MRNNNKQIILLFIIVLFFSCTITNQERKKDKEDVYVCDVENIDKKKNMFIEASNQDLFFENTKSQSKDFAISGIYSSKLSPSNPYGLTTDILKIKPDDYIEVTAWRKSNDSLGVIVIDGGNEFYSAGKNIIEKGANGWEKILHRCNIPPNYNSNKVKIYVWNNGKDTIYFDDLTIVHRDKKAYPEYKDIPTLQLQADETALTKFNKIRLTAFEKTIMVNSDNDYANVVLFDGNDFLNGEFRLKGDLLDHIQGQKWSFRIKLKKDFAWNNMRTFSVQSPSTRDFLSEWVAHKLFIQEDVLTTRYGFVPVKLNNESLGIYAWEEHFEKQLIESQNRREGPIIRFNEDVFWQRVLEINEKNAWDIDFFGAAKIIPFKEGRTSKDSLLNLQLVEAQKLLLQYKNSEVLVSKIFDVNKLAKYYAMLDITQAYHGFTFHNQRFYYNPVTCLLEPVAFDGFIEGGIYKRFEEPVSGLLNPDNITNFQKEEIMLFQVFADPAFRKKYIDYLKLYSKPAFINKFISDYEPKTDSITELIKKEYPYYTFSFDFINSQAEFIQNNLNDIANNIEKLGLAILKIQPGKFKREYTSELNKNLIPFLIHAYYDQKQKNLTVLNFQNSKVKILGAFIKDELPEAFNNRPELEAYNGEKPSKIIIPVDGVPIKILFKIDKETFELSVNQWAFNENISFRQAALETQLPSEITIKDNTIIFDGDYQFKTDIIIRDSFNVIAKPETRIDLVNGASFVSFSAIDFIGSETNPIKITSSDKSANGFSILQASHKSTLNYVNFSDLSSLQRGGWQSPAAVNFYESNVDFENCIFASNFNCDDALNVVRSEFTCTNCDFKNTYADAFDSDFSTGTVSKCTFNNIGNDAIDFSGSHVKILECKMNEIGDKAISGGEQSYLFVSKCDIEKANIGVAAKDLSQLELEEITMNTTVYGLIAFIKKPEYGPAKISVNNIKMKKNIVFHQIEEGSLLNLNGKLIEGREKKLAKKLYQ